MWQGETRRKAVIKLIRTSFHWLRGERKEFFLFAFVDKLKTRLRYKNSENRNSSIKKLLYTIQAID